MPIPMAANAYERLSKLKTEEKNSPGESRLMLPAPWTIPRRPGATECSRMRVGSN